MLNRGNEPLQPTRLESVPLSATNKLTLAPTRVNHADEVSPSAIGEALARAAKESRMREAGKLRLSCI